MARTVDLSRWAVSTYRKKQPKNTTRVITGYETRRIGPDGSTKVPIYEYIPNEPAAASTAKKQAPPPKRSTGEYDDIIGSLKVDQKAATQKTAEIKARQDALTQQKNQAAMKEREAELKASFEKQIAQLNAANQKNINALTGRYDNQSSQFDSLNNRYDQQAAAYNRQVAEFDRLNSRYGQLDTRYGQQTNQLNDLSLRFGQQANQLDALGNRYDQQSRDFSAYQTLTQGQLASAQANYEEQARMVQNLESAFVPEANPNATVGVIGDQRVDDNRPEKSNRLSDLSSLSIVSGLGTASNPLSGLQLA